MIILLQITVENILHCVDHFHHNNKNTDNNVFAAEAVRAVYNSKQHHQSTGNYPGKLIFGKRIFAVQISSLIGTDPIAPYLEQQLGGGVAQREKSRQSSSADSGYYKEIQKGRT